MTFWTLTDDSAVRRMQDLAQEVLRQAALADGLGALPTPRLVKCVREMGTHPVEVTEFLSTWRMRVMMLRPVKTKTGMALFELEEAQLTCEYSRADNDVYEAYDPVLSDHRFTAPTLIFDSLDAAIDAFLSSRPELFGPHRFTGYKTTYSIARDQLELVDKTPVYTFTRSNSCANWREWLTWNGRPRKEVIRDAFGTFVVHARTAPPGAEM